MAKRKIMKIDEDKCNGCGLCIPNCPEGALQIIDGKARLISDLFCDGLGACIGRCPEGAIIIEERDAQGYDERKVMENIIKQGENVIKAHLRHLKEHNQTEYLKQAAGLLKGKGIDISEEKKCSRIREHKHNPSDCLGSKVMDFAKEKESGQKKNEDVPGKKSQLGQWPIQIKLVPANASYLRNSDLLIAADCVPFAYADFHADLLKGKVLLVGCPKLDDAEYSKEKITQILKYNDIKSLTCVHMEVPCCFGLMNIIKEAISASGKNMSVGEVTISMKGEKLK